MRPQVALLLMLALLSVTSCRRRGEQAPSSAASGAGAPHADHDPKHGGIFFMAPDGKHHLEGTYPRTGIVAIHFYDERTQPMPARYFQAKLRLDSAPEGSEKPMTFDDQTNTLSGELNPPPPLPADVVAFIAFPTETGAPGPEERFDFRFTRVGGEPVVAGGHGSQPHAHAARHGGQVVVAGDRHLELVRHQGQFMLFVLDADEKTLPVDGMSATLTIVAGGQPATEIQLTAHGDHFMAASPLSESEQAVAVASVREGAQTRNGRFTLGGMPSQ